MSKENNQNEANVLDELNKGACMGMDAIHYIMDKVEDDDLKKELNRQYKKYKEISDKICNNLNYFESFDQFCNLLKSKEITYARISRCLVHILLDIKKDSMPADKRVSYARVLGFRKDSEGIFKIIKETSSIPLITKLADADKYLDSKNLAILGKDVQASHMYDLVASCRFQNKQHVNEFTRQMIII